MVARLLPRVLSPAPHFPQFFLFCYLKKKAKSGIRNACLVNHYAGNSGGE